MLSDSNVEEQFTEFTTRFEFFGLIYFARSFHDQFHGIVMREVRPLFVPKRKFGEPSDRMCRKTVCAPCAAFKIWTQAE